MKLFKQLTSIFIILSLFFCFFNISYGYSKVEVKNIFPLQSDTSIQGVFGSTDFFFNKYKYWDLNNNNYIQLHFTQSELLKYDASSLTVYLNDIPLKSIPLSYKKTDVILKVNLPKDKISKDYNKISIKLFNRISDNLCADRMNEGTWIVIHKDSFIHLEYNYLTDTPAIKEFPYPYMLEENDSIENSYIVIPDNPELEEVKGALKMSSLLSQKVPFENTSFKILNYSSLSELHKRSNLIFIATYNNISSDFKEKIDIVDNNSGYIKEIKSPYDINKKILIVSGNIEKSLNALSKESLVSQMKESIQKIDFDINQNNINNSQQNSNVTFKDLNYENINLDGPFYKKAQISLDIPSGWNLNNDSYINLHFRYSKVLDFDNSSINLYINDNPVSSKKLTSENSDFDTLKVKIPKEFLNEKFLNLKIVFYLSLDDIICKILSDVECWASILDTSYIELPHEVKTISILENYPYPFVSQNKLNNLLLIIEDLKDINKINIYSDILSTITKNFKNIPDFEVSKTLENIHKDKNIILISSPDKDTLIKNYSNKLYLKYDHEFKNFLSDENIKVIKNDKNHSVSMQLLSSPLNDKKNLLLITSPSTQTLELSKYILSNNSLIHNLKGNVVLLDEEGIKDFAYYGKAKNMKIDKIESEKTDNQNIKFSQNTILLIAMVVVIVILMLIVYFSIKKELKHKK